MLGHLLCALLLEVRLRIPLQENLLNIPVVGWPCWAAGNIEEMQRWAAEMRR